MKPELIKLLREEAHEWVDRMTPERLCHFVGHESFRLEQELKEQAKEGIAIKNIEQPKETLQVVLEGEIPTVVEEPKPTPPEPPKENETILEMKKRLTPVVIAWRNKKAEETGEAGIKILKETL